MTKIEWTDETWNPVTGCTKVSAGCAHCYAERDFPRTASGQFVGPRGKHVAKGFVKEAVGGVLVSAQTGTRMSDGFRKRRFTDVKCHPDRLEKPLRWRKPRRVFVNSMSDLFHEDVMPEFIDNVFGTMLHAERHTFQVLTKRPERARMILPSVHAFLMRRFGQTVPWPLPNVWLGVSCEDQATADQRIPVLLDTPAAVRFVSAEPLLGPVDLTKNWRVHNDEMHAGHFSVESIEAINWVIVGGESGTKARPCDVAWIRSIVEQCKAANVACFVKQIGANSGGRTGDDCTDPGPGDWWAMDLLDRKGGDPDEWPADLRVREYPVDTEGHVR